ncbi:hypothetical protein MRX96_044469 [Rhipicephalus microplus]
MFVAAQQIVGCKHVCEEQAPSVGVFIPRRQCLAVSTDAVKHMSRLVKYKCELGICEEGNKCNASDLLISCWKV